LNNINHDNWVGILQSDQIKYMNYSDVHKCFAKSRNLKSFYKGLNKPNLFLS